MDDSTALNFLAKLPILVVDDDERIVKSTTLLLQASGIIEVISLTDSQHVMPLLYRQDVSVILLDLQMPTLSGDKLLVKIKNEFPDIPVIIATANDELDIAIKCMQAGAFDYQVKPIEKNRLISSVLRAIEIRNLQGELLTLKTRLLEGKLSDERIFNEIITCEKNMRSLFQYIEAIAPSDQPVLITGETGTGKELFAKALHKASGRKGKLITVNVAGLDDTIFSDTLFGHEKGAYTGADRKREGLIAQASSGTLFLDEIGDLELSSQIKILRLLQDRTYYSLGSDHLQRSTARIVVATNCNLAIAISNKTFRKDLYYRLRAHQLNLPSLRERKQDLPLLLNHFVEKASTALNKNKPAIPQELYILLANYSFPGNVRELETMTFDAVARNQANVLSQQSFKEIIGEENSTKAETTVLKGDIGNMAKLYPDRLPSLKEAEQLLIIEAMQRAENNQGIAATMLGISRQALNKRLVRGRLKSKED
jgi:DNA-binding NtrC family response regulator